MWGKGGSKEDYFRAKLHTRQTAYIAKKQSNQLINAKRDSPQEFKVAKWLIKEIEMFLEKTEFLMIKVTCPFMWIKKPKKLGYEKLLKIEFD